jgi:hypothetical protein
MGWFEVDEYNVFIWRSVTEVAKLRRFECGNGIFVQIWRSIHGRAPNVRKLENPVAASDSEG